MDPSRTTSRQTSAASLLLPRTAEDRLRDSLASMPVAPQEPSLRQRDQKLLLQADTHDWVHLHGANASSINASETDAPSPASQPLASRSLPPLVLPAVGASTANAAASTTTMTSGIHYVEQEDILRRRLQDSTEDAVPAATFPTAPALGQPRDMGYISNIVTGVNVHEIKDCLERTTLSRRSEPVNASHR